MFVSDIFMIKNCTQYRDQPLLEWLQNEDKEPMEPISNYDASIIADLGTIQRDEVRTFEEIFREEQEWLNEAIQPTNQERRDFQFIQEIISQEEQSCREILDQLAEQDKKTLAWLNGLAEKDMKILHKLCGDSDLVG